MLKTERVGLLVTPKEKNVLARLAELRGGLSQAALIRCLIREEARRQGAWSKRYSNKTAMKGVSHERSR